MVARSFAPKSGRSTPASLARFTTDSNTAPYGGHRITFFVRRPNEILFLQLMIRHHQGRIDMAATGRRKTRNDAVRVTALAPVDEQTQELQITASN
jgi:uncharacterized protein (DUF305 family)